jgi:hypothetical protein
MRFVKRMASAAALIFAISAQAGAAPAGPSIDAGPAVLQAPVVMALAAVQDPPPIPKPDVDVTVTTERTTWYADPVWITIGVLAAILIIGLIIAASRSGGSSTTVVK